MIPVKSFAAIAFALMISCSPKPGPVTDEKPQMFTYSSTYSVTDHPQNLDKYQDFKFHIHPIGESMDSTFPPPDVKREGNQLTVSSTVKIPYPHLNQQYEWFFSFTFDGKPMETQKKSGPLISY